MKRVHNHPIAVFLGCLVVFVGGCGPKHVNAPISLTPERRMALDARVTGRVGPADIYPDLSITPGVAATDVTQENIESTICVSGFTNPPRRPPTSYTNGLKEQGFTDYGLSDRNKSHYEEDHLISLELGGDPKNPKNLWPEPYNASIPDGGARKKDTVEKYLNRQVCTRKLTLAEAQQLIVVDWYKVYESMPRK
jgi:hypothetical protein